MLRIDVSACYRDWRVVYDTEQKVFRATKPGESVVLESPDPEGLRELINIRSGNGAKVQRERPIRPLEDEELIRALRTCSSYTKNCRSCPLRDRQEQPNRTPCSLLIMRLAALRLEQSLKERKKK